ncbi:MAG: carbon-nitrogen hydrolase family protein [Mariprofundus sp.]|nr:carbon-nitrogen hydrolase family protein [Mariprofundus sp.]
MRVACVQMCSGINRDENLATVERLLDQAGEQGAELVVLPETFSFMGGSEAEKRVMAESQSESIVLNFLSEQAAKHKMMIVGGSVLFKSESNQIRNACPVFDAKGSLLAVYDKMHLFDMDYEGEVYHESDLIKAGNLPVSIPVGAFKAGLSICYDLRFPELFRHYIEDDCDLLCNVAAFTAVTGRVHWQVLLQARAIENQSYVLASAQAGTHPDGRQTWGHSMVIDPWGRVLCELAEGEGVIVADLSKKYLEQVRKSLPSLQHRRL